ncbi:hypothetical protein [uncultured Bacteroides sp.]|uniref:hypothetical protein n=1 Tax=uncultured Bacteroides sp. TaxID=162156 RepID=UPI0026099338|nr:hypothetical protein [uncultured Bacteroides sp.]
MNTLKNNHLQITHLKQATQKHPYIINKEKEKEKEKKYFFYRKRRRRKRKNGKMP